VTIEDEVRTMLRTRASDVQPADDAWARIESRLGTSEVAARRQPRRVLAAVAVAAAVLVGAVVVGVSDDDAPTSVVTPVTVDDESLPPHLWAAPEGTSLDEAAAEFISARVREGDVPVTTESTFDGYATARVTGRGVETELAMRDVGGRWLVIAASSDLVPIHGPRYDGRAFAADVVAEIPGQLDLLVRAVDEGDSVEAFTGVFSGRVEPRQEVPVHHDRGNEPGIGLVAKLVAADGTIAYSEVWAAKEADPAVPTAAIVSLWPTTDAAGLDVLQQQAARGQRPDLLDPQLVARNYIDEFVRPGGVEVGELEPTIDPGTSWVGYQLAGGHGSVLLRRHGGERGIWYVTGATADIVEIVDVRAAVSAGALHVEVDVGLPATTVDVTAWVGGRGPVRQSAPAVSHTTPQAISIPGAQDATLLMVVVRDGDTVLGIAARHVG
jgi:hypothetical protein